MGHLPGASELDKVAIWQRRYVRRCLSTDIAYRNRSPSPPDRAAIAGCRTPVSNPTSHARPSVQASNDVPPANDDPHQNASGRGGREAGAALSLPAADPGPSHIPSRPDALPLLVSPRPSRGFRTPGAKGVREGTSAPRTSRRLAVRGFVERCRVPFTFIGVGWWTQLCLSLPLHSTSPPPLKEMIWKDIGKYASGILPEARSWNHVAIVWEDEVSQAKAQTLDERPSDDGDALKEKRSRTSPSRSTQRLAIHDFIQRLRVPYTFIDVGWWTQLYLPPHLRSRSPSPSKETTWKIRGHGNTRNLLTHDQNIGRSSLNCKSNHHQYTFRTSNDTSDTQHDPTTTPHSSALPILPAAQ
ncbi:hypothetical protein BD310DRAFT_952889 [Dichomitus squalens]|uniref:NmrA-like domain-containing protein n=1 Tax=Dichomitus squalens TaxID=114155 RepID=A0A4Q9PDK9_9APHY|nr:hypothetical protein BD310DRAFT_952889 [Dichomitus squalens]